MREKLRIYDDDKACSCWSWRRVDIKTSAKIEQKQKTTGKMSKKNPENVKSLSLRENVKKKSARNEKSQAVLWHFRL